MIQIDINSKKVWTLEEVQAYSGYEITYLQKLCSDRKIPYYNPDNARRVFFKSDEIIEWLTANKNKTKEEITNPDKYNKNAIN